MAKRSQVDLESTLQRITRIQNRTENEIDRRKRLFIHRQVSDNEQKSHIKPKWPSAAHCC